MVTKLALRNTRWDDWMATPIAGDASARRYFRLTSGDASAILMLDPPSAGNGTVIFEQIAQRLRDHGLCAPDIYHHDPNAGVMVIEDLGGVDVASHLAKSPSDEGAIYAAITDMLAKIGTVPATRNMVEMTHDTAAGMVDLAAIHYANRPQAAPDIKAAILHSFQSHVDPQLTFAMRDFHAENLIWRAEKNNDARIGLLDFQDACMGPVGYDLMSLLRDARRDVSADVAAHMIEQFKRSHSSVTDAQLACIGAQRNLRILGIFSRLATTGKPHYMTLVPRVWRQLLIDLNHPSLTDLKTIVQRILPEPGST